MPKTVGKKAEVADLDSALKFKATVLGIDPGSRLCGYGLVGPEGQYVTSGTIVLPEGAPLSVRLKELHAELGAIIKEHKPGSAAVEKVFFAKSVQSALTLGHARGVALLSAAECGLEVFEYSPLEVKKSVTGYGRAEKAQVQEMVKRLLNIKYKLSPDGADALAVALCHRHMLDHEAAVRNSR